LTLGQLIRHSLTLRISEGQLPRFVLEGMRIAFKTKEHTSEMQSGKCSLYYMGFDVPRPHDYQEFIHISASGTEINLKLNSLRLRAGSFTPEHRSFRSPPIGRLISVLGRRRANTASLSTLTRKIYHQRASGLLPFAGVLSPRGPVVTAMCALAADEAGTNFD
jgi:hypothetical protein